MEKLGLTCDDLDAVGVYFIEGRASSLCNLTRVKVREAELSDLDESKILYLNIKRVVYFEEVDFKTKVYYGADEKSQQVVIDLSIDEIEELIASRFPAGRSRYVRMGNYYIVNQQCLDRVSLDERKLYLHNAKYKPFSICMPEEPSRREMEEFRPLVPNYTKHKLSELKETMPELVKYMMKYKRYKSYMTSLKEYKELVFRYYGGK